MTKLRCTECSATFDEDEVGDVLLCPSCSGRLTIADTMGKYQVNELIRFLYISLEPNYIKSFKEDLLPKNVLAGTWHDPLIATQALARRIAEHYHLTVTTVVVSFSFDLPVPGRVELSNSSDFFVEINYEYKSQPDCISAILAHEITHIFLHHKKIKLETVSQNELLTDTTATYLGCGILILNGAMNWHILNGSRGEYHQRHFGYLKPDDFGYILAKRDLLIGFLTQICAK